MSYLVLARKYRPTNFTEVVGQSHITDILQNAITSDRLGHAYLFCGPRGIGKTSCARILAKALNCEKGVTVEPCGECSACTSIAQGNSFDVLEIDGASNRGIDEIRTIRENVKFAPSYGRYKIYIIDEVHMLTTEAFNALLKTLEEPPEHVKFIFATTDPNKLPATIISRCQRFDFKRISFKELCESLLIIAKKEKIKVDSDAVYAIAKTAKGSFRDALSVLDQIGALTDQNIKGDDVYGMLGLVELDLMFDLVDALGRGDCASALCILDTIIDRGKDIKQLGKDLIEHFRHLMVFKMAGSSVSQLKEMGKLVDYPPEIKDLIFKQSKFFHLNEVLAAIDIFIDAQETARITESERTPMEIAFAKLTLSLNRPAQVEKDVEPSKGFIPGDMIKNERGQVNASDDPVPDVKLESKVELESEIVPEPESKPELEPKPKPEPEPEPEPELEPAPESASEPSGSIDLDFDSLVASWDALTHAVSRERMSLATYLQEGVLQSLRGNKLMIGFSPENKFFKETLESSDDVKIIEDCFSAHLKTQVLVGYEIVEDVKPKITEKDNPAIKGVLDDFGGEITSRWHNK